MTPEGEVVEGDCIEVMGTWPESSIDAIVADPPYGIGFMGHEWDQPGEFGPVRGNGQPRAFASTAGVRRPDEGSHDPGPDAALERQLRRSQRRGSQRGPASGAGHRKDRAAALAGEPPRPDAMQAGRYDLSPTANLRYQGWCEAWGREALRVVKPGGHALVFGGTRTFHRLVAGLEDAGWEVRDCLVWGYASGFPKSLDVGKAIDRMAGAEREVIGDKLDRPGYHLHPHKGNAIYGDGLGQTTEDQRARAAEITAPATEDAATWQGWGTALKPAWEPIVLVRKPFRGTVAGNVLEHGTGALNIDGTRIPVAPGDEPEGSGAPVLSRRGEGPAPARVVAAAGVGRWPANVVLTDPIFDGEFAEVVGGGWQTGGGNPSSSSSEASARSYGGYSGGETGKVPVDTAGAYSRFFLIPKSAKAEREPVVRLAPADIRENIHPTVKPVELIRHLVRLITRPGGLVLDPFLGSGTTALAAEAEGFRWVGIERQPEYVVIARQRLIGHRRGLGLDVGAPTSARRQGRAHWPSHRKPHGIMGAPRPTGGQDGLLERVEEP